MGLTLTTVHMAALRMAERHIPQAATTVTSELRGQGYLERRHFVLGEGWLFVLTDSGKALLNPTPAVRGPARLDTWID